MTGLLLCAGCAILVRCCATAGLAASSLVVVVAEVGEEEERNGFLGFEIRIYSIFDFSKKSFVFNRLRQNF